jgi:hypothetical protein
MTTSPKACRTGQPCAPTTFVEAVDCLAHHSAVSLGEAAGRIGRDPNYLRKACSAYADTHPLRGDLIVPLTLAFDNPVLVAYLAQACGGVFVRVPQVQVGTTDLVDQAGRAMQRFGVVLQDVSLAVTDGKVTAEEADRVARGADAVIASAEALKRLAAAKVSASGDAR